MYKNYCMFDTNIEKKYKKIMTEISKISKSPGTIYLILGG